MTRRERLRRCFAYEDLDRPAVYSRTGFPADDPTYDRLRALLREKTELMGGWSSQAVQPPHPTETHTEPHTDDWDRRLTTLRTPSGDLTSTYLVSRKGQPGLHETFLIDGPEDAERYLSLPVPPVGGDVSAFFAAEAEMGDAGITQVHLGFNPAGFVAETCGSETFAILSISHRYLLHALCQRYMEALLARVDFLVAQGVGPHFSMLGEEYLVPPLHGRDDFYDFNVRYDKPIIARIHEAGGRIHIHSHGSVRTVFDGFLEMGADVLHPIEPPPLGDITAAQAKDLARGHLCLDGNLQIHRMYEATPDQIRTEVDALIADAFDDGRGLIVSPSASPYIRGEGEHCYPAYEAMVETVLACSR